MNFGLFVYICSCDEYTEASTVRAGDQISVSVYREEDLSGQYEVRDDGSIEFPLLGSVNVSGLSSREISAKLSTLLAKDYLVNPSITVSFETTDSRLVMVLGSVSRPGSYPFPSDQDLTTLGAIAIAGGFTRYANPNRTKIIRTQENGEKITIDANIKDVLNGNTNDIVLQEGDLIIVPESTF